MNTIIEQQEGICAQVASSCTRLHMRWTGIGIGIARVKSSFPQFQEKLIKYYIKKRMDVND
jgi:hypothetical protein